MEKHQFCKIETAVKATYGNAAGEAAVCAPIWATVHAVMEWASFVRRDGAAACRGEWAYHTNESLEAQKFVESLNADDRAAIAAKIAAAASSLPRDIARSVLGTWWVEEAAEAARLLRAG